MDEKNKEILNLIKPYDNILPILAVQWWNQIPELAAFKAVYRLPFVINVMPGAIKHEQLVVELSCVIGFMDVWAAVLQIEEETYRHFPKEDQGRICWFGKIFDWMRTSRTMINQGDRNNPPTFLPTGLGVAAAMQGVFAMIDANEVTRAERQKAADFIHSWARGINEFKEERMKAVETPKIPTLKPDERDNGGKREEFTGT